MGIKEKTTEKKGTKKFYQENKMGIMPVNKLLVTMSLPMVIAMLVQAMYNIVDSIFVARLSEDALAAVTLAFPIQNLMISIAVGTAVGINAMLSRSLGEGNQEHVNKTANNGVFLAVLSYLVIAVFGALFSNWFFAIQTDIKPIIDQGSIYLLICTVCSFGLFMEITYERLLQSTGKTFYTMITQGIGAVINIILDPILIFGLLGFPAMGVKGAAIATVVGQIVAMFLAIYLNKVKNTEVQLKFRGFRPEKWVIARIYSVGVPSIVMTSVASVMTFGINRILLNFSSTAIAVFGVYFRLQSFVLMPVFGLNNGMVPILAYNYGAGNRERIIQTIKLSSIYATVIMVLGLVCFMAVPNFLLNFFDASPGMLEIGVPALRIISLSFLFAGFCIVAGSVFQALGNGMLSLIVAIARQLVVLLPSAIILSYFMGINGVWIAFPLAEIVSLTFSVIFLRRIYLQKIKPL